MLIFYTIFKLTIAQPDKRLRSQILRISNPCFGKCSSSADGLPVAVVVVVSHSKTSAHALTLRLCIVECVCQGVELIGAGAVVVDYRGCELFNGVNANNENCKNKRWYRLVNFPFFVSWVSLFSICGTHTHTHSTHTHTHTHTHSHTAHTHILTKKTYHCT